MSCIVCGKHLSPLFETKDYRRPQEPTSYAVGWCSHCRCGRVEGEFSPETVSGFYAVPYYTHGERDIARSKPSIFERVRTYIAWRGDSGRPLEVSEGVGPTLLDIGCGDGENLRRFSDAGFLASGIEPDPKARAVALKYGKAFQGTAEEISPEISGQRFDTVLLSHVLEHCRDPRAALMNVRSLLATDGRVIIEVPNNDALAFWRYKECWPWTDVPRHLHFFTEASLHALLDQCGFQATRTLFVGYCRQFQPGWLGWHERIAETLHASTRVGLGSWTLLAQTLMAQPRRKYDSLRVHAVLRS